MGRPISKVQLVDGGYARTLYDNRVAEGLSPAQMNGNGDTVLDDQDVLRFHFEQWAKYQEDLAHFTPFVIPWALDDYDPQTTSDKFSRQKADDLIMRAKAWTGSRTPIDIGALGKAIFEESLKDPFFFRNARTVNLVDGDEENAIGSAPRVVPKREVTALEFLETRIGTCTDRARVLMALYDAAGIPSRAVNVTVGENGQWMDHAALQIEVAKDRWITVDPSLARFGPNYEAMTPLTRAEFAGVYYWMAAPQYFMGALLYPAFSLVDTAHTFLRKGQREEGMRLLRGRYPHPKDPRPELALLATLHLQAATPDAMKRLRDQIFTMRPKIFEELESTISQYLSLRLPADIGYYRFLMGYFIRTPQEFKRFSFLTVQYSAILKDVEKTHSLVFSILDEPSLATSEDDLGILQSSLNETNDLDGLVSLSKRWLERSPDSYAARAALLQINYMRGAFEQVIQLGAPLLGDPRFVHFTAMVSSSYASTGNVAQALQVLGESNAGMSSGSDLLLKALFTLALGDTAGFHTLVQRLPADNDPGVSALLTAMDYYIHGDIARAEIMKKTFLDHTHDRAQLEDSIKSTKYLPADLRSWLLQPPK